MPPQGETLQIKGLRELLRVTDQLPKETKKAVRDALRKVAEPVREEATSRFLSEVSPVSSRTRFGISVRKAGTVTVEQRRRRTTGKHPEFGVTQMKAALIPALASNEDEVVAGMENVIAYLERQWVK